MQIDVTGQVGNHNPTTVRPVPPLYPGFVVESVNTTPWVEQSNRTGRDSR